MGTLLGDLISVVERSAGGLVSCFRGVIMESGRFYLVRKNSAAHKIIDQKYADRDAAMKERWKFVNRIFPESKKRKSGWQIASFQSAFGNGGSWKVVPPNGYEMPSDWKFHPRSGSWSPKVSTKAGKALDEEMNQDKYYLPCATDFGTALGIDSVWVGMSLYSPGISPTNDGRYIVILNKEHKVPETGLTRISDIVAEGLLAEKPKKSKSGNVEAS